MQKFAARTPDDNNQKTLAQRTREAGLPATHQKKNELAVSRVRHTCHQA